MIRQHVPVSDGADKKTFPHDELSEHVDGIEPESATCPTKREGVAGRLRRG